MLLSLSVPLLLSLWSPPSHVFRVAGVEGEHGDGDELDQRAQEPEAEDVVEVLEEVSLLQRVSLDDRRKSA